MTFALRELEATLDAMRGARAQLLTLMSERKLQVPQVLGHVPLLHRRALGNFVRRELGRAQGVCDAFAHRARAFHRCRRRMPRAAMRHEPMVTIFESAHEF